MSEEDGRIRAEICPSHADQLKLRLHEKSYIVSLLNVSFIVVVVVIKL